MKAFKTSLKLVALTGAALLSSMSAQAGIANTKHNLSWDGVSALAAGQVAGYSGTTEICIFCHTPHGSATNAPLWNRGMTAAQEANLVAYTSNTLDGDVLLSGAPSLACLSCHDGQQAMNTVINAPSTTTNYNYNGVTTPATFGAGTWTGTAQAGGEISATTPVPNLGVDLKNDHPVAIPYAGGGLKAVVSTADFVDGDFNAPDSGTIGGSQAWWVETAADTVANTRTKEDLILYARSYTKDKTGTVAAYTTGFVECASCHDPHSTNAQFLRPAGGNQNSQVCLACHNK